MPCHVHLYIARVCVFCIIVFIKIQVKEKYGRQFTPEDSVVIFEVSGKDVMKFGNAIHRDQEIVYL